MSYRDIRPNQTIYVNNLNEKLPKEELRRSLYYLFSQFGPILEVVALKTPKMRGQAFIVFDNIDSSTKAFREMPNFPFYGKAMRIAFAKSKSDVLSHREGDFTTARKRKHDSSASSAMNGVSDEESKSSNSQRKRTPQQIKTASASIPVGAPNNILFVQNFPHETTQTMLTMLFQQYNGFKDVRTIAGKPGICFVDYGTDYEAAKALDALQGFSIKSNHPMQISYAKK
uniref:U2 small nuclear ribonucleoprotein B n=1 Tax=Hirondellea gigas TaxID=1518452 RepID=A0A6A7G6G6_9CRUS